MTGMKRLRIYSPQAGINFDALLYLAPVVAVVVVMVITLVVAVYHVYLPADLAACRVRKSVHVRIGGTVSDERDYGCEIIRIGCCRLTMPPAMTMSAVIVPVKSSDPGLHVWIAWFAGAGFVAV